MAQPGLDPDVTRMTRRLRAAAADAGVTLPTGYAHRVAAQGLRLADQIGVTAADDGVVIHTAPDAGHGLPIVLGFADGSGQWYRNGTRHTPDDADSAPADKGAAS